MCLDDYIAGLVSPFPLIQVYDGGICSTSSKNQGYYDGHHHGFRKELCAELAIASLSARPVLDHITAKLLFSSLRVIFKKEKIPSNL